jgi:hypothetical protein
MKVPVTLLILLCTDLVPVMLLCLSLSLIRRWSVTGWWRRWRWRAWMVSQPVVEVVAWRWWWWWLQSGGDDNFLLVWQLQLPHQIRRQIQGME